MSDGLRLLASICVNNSTSLLREVTREVFVEEEITVYDMVRSHYRQYGRLPTIETIEEEAGVDMPTAPEVAEYYVRRVQDRRMYSLVRDEFTALREALRNFDMRMARDVITRMQSSTRVARTETDIRSLREAFVSVMAEYEQAALSPGLSGIPFGWSHIDIATNGLMSGDLVSIVARPGMGKTYLLLKMAEAAASLGFSVLVVSMELTIEQMVRRYSALSCGINPEYLRRGTLSIYAERRLRDHMDQLAYIDNVHFLSGGFNKTPDDVDLLVQEYNPDIVYIDGAYLMKPAQRRPNASRIEVVAEVFDSLKQMTLTRRIPVVVTTQLNRMAGKKGKDSSLETIAYSDTIATHSSLVISLQEGEAPYQKTRRTLSFLKGREGESGDYAIHYEFTPINFAPVVEEAELDDDGQPLVSITTPTAAGASLDWMG